MTRKVRRHADFEEDFLCLLESIVERGEASWIAILLDGVKRASAMLAEVPGAGSLIEQRGTVEMRKLILPRGPYVAWYVYDTASRDGDVWLVRLFHARQRRPLPRAGTWAKRVRSARRSKR